MDDTTIGRIVITVLVCIIIAAIVLTIIESTRTIGIGILIPFTIALFVAVSNHLKDPEEEKKSNNYKSNDFVPGTARDKYQLKRDAHKLNQHKRDMIHIQENRPRR